MGATGNFFAKKKKWSIIKDDILAWYLTPYISKILSTRKPLILVDCFAGKGKFDDGSDGSPLIIARKIKEVLELGRYSQIKGVFIEKKYGRNLKANLNGFTNCMVVDGTFEESFEDIILPNKNSNAFIYIDPYGIKSLDFNRFNKLKNCGFNTYEMLMNFNTFGFLREGCRLLKYNYQIECPDCSDEDEEFYENEDLDNNNGINLLNTIADGNYWQSILEGYQSKKYSMYVAEELFVDEYLKRLKSKKIFKYTTNIPVTLKTKNIPKYRLIFGTNHYQGLILMCNNMNKQWKHIVDEQRNGQMVLFEYDYPDRDIIKDFDIQKGVICLLESHSSMNLEDLYCKLIEQFGIAYSESEYAAIIKSMGNEQKINISRVPSTTPTGKPATSFDYTKYKIGVKLNK